MSIKISTRDIEDDFESKMQSRDSGKNIHRFKKRRTDLALMDEAVRLNGVEAVPDSGGFTPTYTGSRQEREWIISYLGLFYEEGLIVDVLSKVKGGKEANVYCCQAAEGVGAPYLAAKIYRPRMLRNLRNDALYREGRAILDEEGKGVYTHSVVRAVEKGSSFGKAISHISWLEHEVATLKLLWKAGAKVPRPYANGNNTIIMEYLGEADGAAPALNEVYLSRAEARSLYDQLIVNVEIMLSCNRVHGDLSAYNVLYWDGDFRIIDFPQAINPNTNRNSFQIFKRDVTRLCQYFERYGIRSRPADLAWKMWQKHGFGQLWVPDDTDWEDKAHTNE